MLKRKANKANPGLRKSATVMVNFDNFDNIDDSDEEIVTKVKYQNFFDRLVYSTQDRRYKLFDLIIATLSLYSALSALLAAATRNIMSDEGKAINKSI